MKTKMGNGADDFGHFLRRVQIGDERAMTNAEVYEAIAGVA
jgi:hypothetical protein